MAQYEIAGAHDTPKICRARGHASHPERENRSKGVPAAEQSLDVVAYLAPGTPAEQKVAEIWSAVLRVPSVGANDNFFALGGHPLLATQIVSRVRQTMGVDLPLRSFFESPTLEALAARIVQIARPIELAPIPRVSRNSPLPLSSAQERLWSSARVGGAEPGAADFGAAAPHLRGGT
jgi:hypothetical protein